jgi:hypothetical protein
VLRKSNLAGSCAQRILRSSTPSKLEATADFEERVLSQVKKNHWRSMCAYTHTGGLHVQRGQSASAVEPSYSPDEVAAVVNFAEIIGSVAAVAISASPMTRHLPLRYSSTFARDRMASNPSSTSYTL